jgi:hypothetical protein
MAWITQDVPGGKVNILGGRSIGQCPLPSGLRDRAISLYSSKTVDEKEILRTVSNKVKLSLCLTN